MSIPLLDLFINQGEDWSSGMDFVNEDDSPVDLTGYTFQTAIKNSYFHGNVAANIAMTVINAPAGNVIASLNAATTGNLSAGTYVYDVVMIDTIGNSTKILGGNLTIKPSTNVNPPNNGMPANGIL